MFFSHISSPPRPNSHKGIKAARSSKEVTCKTLFIIYKIETRFSTWEKYLHPFSNLSPWKHLWLYSLEVHTMCVTGIETSKACNMVHIYNIIQVDLTKIKRLSFQELLKHWNNPQNVDCSDPLKCHIQKRVQNLLRFDDWPFLEFLTRLKLPHTGRGYPRDSKLGCYQKHTNLLT